MNKKPHNEENEPQLKVDGAETSELKKDTFSIPEGYFEDLTPRIMQSVRDLDTASSQGFDWNSLFGKRVLIPAFSVATLLIAGIYFLKHQSSRTIGIQEIAMGMTLQELDLFAEFEPTELLAYDLVDYEQLNFDETAWNGIDEDDVLDYLMYEDEFELNTIVEEIDI